MAVSPPSLMLKIIWMTHFVLSSWAQFCYGFLSLNLYWYTHLAVLAFGFWAIVSNESTDAVLMFMVTLIFSVLNDIICLSLYEPRAYDIYERTGNGASSSQRNEYRFALGMCITNLLLKPLTIFLLYRIYRAREQGTEFDTGIPGFGPSVFGGNRSSYDHIEDPGPYDKSREPPQYQAPTYQEPPPSAPSDHS